MLYPALEAPTITRGTTTDVHPDSPYQSCAGQPRALCIDPGRLSPDHAAADPCHALVSGRASSFSIAYHPLHTGRSSVAVPAAASRPPLAGNSHRSVALYVRGAGGLLPVGAGHPPTRSDPQGTQRWL